MGNFLKILLFFYPIISFSQSVEITDTPQEYIQHISKVWDVDQNKIVYITNQSTLDDLASVIHNSVLTFVAGELSTSAEILDGRRIVNPKQCGLALNNLDLENIKKHLQKGNDYRKIQLKKVIDDTDYIFNNQLTTVLIYSKKLDFFMGDYFKVLKELSQRNVDYLIIIFDNEINNQIPNALKSND